METKRCLRCGKRRPLTKFHSHPTHKDRLQSWCGACQVRYQYEWRHSHPGAQRRRNKRAFETRRAWLDEHLSKCSCEICGESDPVVLDFHHRDPKKKVGSISNMIRRGHGLPSIKKEIKKCMVVCACCHRRITWHQRHSPHLTMKEIYAIVSKRPGSRGRKETLEMAKKMKAKKTAKKPAKKGKC